MFYKPEIVKAYFKSQGLPDPVFEWHYIPGRKFRMDVAWPELKIGIEVEGGLWMKAAHSTGKGIKRDMEKGNLSILAGWRVFRVEPKELCMLETVKMVKCIMPVDSLQVSPDPHKVASGRAKSCPN